ncbi:MAG: MFS transporter [Desulfobacteraceae bacterium]|jgi:MFS family permease
MPIEQRTIRFNALSNRVSKLNVRYVYFILIALQYTAISLTASNGTIYYLLHGVTKSWIGYLGVISAITIVVFEFPTGIMADRFGCSLSVSVSFILRGIAALLTIFCYGPVMFSIITFISSIGFTCFSGASEAWAFSKDASIKKNIAKFFADTFIINGIARIVGGSLGGGLASLSGDIPFIVSGTTLLVTAILFITYDYFLPKEDSHAKNIKQQSSIRYLYSDILNTLKIIVADKTLWRITVSGAFFIVFSVIPFIFWQPFFYESTDSMSALGGIWAVFISMNILGSLASKSGWIKNKDPLDVFRMSIFLSGMALLISALAKSCLVISLISFFLYHFFIGVIGPIRGNLINQRIGNERRASILSFISFSESFGSILSYSIFGYLCNFYELNLVLALSVIPLLFSLLVAIKIPKEQDEYPA